MCEDFVDKVENLYICAHCSQQIFGLDAVAKHHNLVLKSKKLDQRIITYKFDGFSTSKKIEFYNVIHILPDQLANKTSTYYLKTEYSQLKKEFKLVTCHVARLNLKPKLQNVLKCFFSLGYHRKVPTMISQLILRLASVPVSEAICESYGSVMENYHRRFTHSDINDEQIQREMFVCLIGPPPTTLSAERLIKKTVDRLNCKHVLSEYARFYMLIMKTG